MLNTDFVKFWKALVMGESQEGLGGEVERYRGSQERKIGREIHLGLSQTITHNDFRASICFTFFYKSDFLSLLRSPIAQDAAR